jgi:hypothetical protein
MTHPLAHQLVAMSRPIEERDQTVGQDTRLSHLEAKYAALAILQLFDAFFEKAAGSGLEHQTNLITQPLVRAQIADLKKELAP